MNYLIIGLGNPDLDYEGTRHNVGRLFLDLFKGKYDFSDWGKKREYKAFVSTGKVYENNIVLMKPDNFMNNSGDYIKKIIEHFSIEKNIVIHDDIYLPLGSFRISNNKGSGGHNGIKSIIKKLGDTNFIRVRIGISPVKDSGEIVKPDGENTVHDYVLNKFSKKERDALAGLEGGVLDAISLILDDKMLISMNKHNKSVLK